MTDDHLQIVYLDPAGLTEDPANSRTHDDEQIAQIRASIDAFGFRNPVALDEAGVVRAGNGRLRAALLDPPLASIPTITHTGLTAEQWTAYAIADNRIAESAGWDEAQLRASIEALGDALDVSLLGFSTDDLEALLNPPSASQADPEDTPEPPADPVTRLGDIWLLGKHRIICGDSADAATVEALLDGAKPKLMVTDPPYGIGYSYDAHDDRDNDANADLVERVFSHAPDGKVWTPGLMNLARDVERFGRAKVLCWHKGFAASGNGIGGASTWEPVLVIAPAAKKLPNDYLDFKVVIEQHEGRSLREYHPCPKPVALYGHLIESLSPKGALIYEPFSGSGTTIIAAEMTGRRCYAIELSENYVDVAVIRWETFTGQAATLASTGQTFAQVAEERLDVAKVAAEG